MILLISAYRVHLSRFAFFQTTFRSKKLLLRDGIHHFEKEGHARVQGHLQQEGLREVQQRPHAMYQEFIFTKCHDHMK